MSEVSLRGETVTLTVSSEQESGNKTNQFVQESDAGLREQKITPTHSVIKHLVRFLYLWAPFL